MGKRVGLLAGLLVLALGSGSGAVAQEPSPEASPPPWFGGRVEMPEHGFALTLPDDWVAFDTAVDWVSQVEAASPFLDPVVWSPDELDFLADAASQGVRLHLVHATSGSVCGMSPFQGVDMPVDDMADRLFEAFVDASAYRDVEPPQRIDLPAGPAYLIRMSAATEVGVRLPYSAYLLGMDGGLLMMGCSTDDAPLEDVWLSIAETIEFLPVEE